MLMGANGIYADGKAQPMTANGNSDFDYQINCFFFNIFN